MLDTLYRLSNRPACYCRSSGEEAVDERGEPIPIVEAGAPGGGPSIEDQEANIDS